ncbi:MAG: valine--tRNA ligase [Sphingobacteriia bacterium 24-36-13]|jgi:valyl-tRNA synthetase|nr:valine--tRNA ligase [Sediminibacterium sp.]OYY11313.1 MAG: valine--tRNA ligase [Sphingobacteriia bacterium 35-36-14]OYZ55637.1 MAG: valine--tRNA ligase [Sphingobacteriia bacterium 24-36-13]OZA64721.1 MAG: valine--tRNA ligase [Sphingobacteriia bacterium 39-36-14]HQS23290.1 valine--tRNA ligase [Sediminibacterium sp.]HQS36060.1 valine--tRNA ligase [Sediminibacterium sp.]
MELSKNYIPTEIEAKWYKHWINKNYFSSKPDDREPYTVVIPPPNVTGVLHMGHCLNNTIQDILVRRARMQGKNACWVPGTDHASIATEAKVVGMLREKGIAKSSLSRSEFLDYAWEWKEKYGGIILQQLRKMGCSLDWDRTSFTMDPDYYDSVINVFIDLYKKGYIYRGKRMINWDVKAKTALSDEEVIYKEVQSKLYHVKYHLENGGTITIATVRPETILGDAAICVNPADERYKFLHGQYAFVPLINRKIKIIPDEYVTLDFGTGALKVTPAHDMNDYQLGQKYNLEIIDTMNDDGTMSDAAQMYIGLDRFEVRKKIVADLEAAGHIDKIEEYTNQVGFSERTDAVVEPRLSLQWWVSMKDLAAPALTAVMDDEIHFHPAKFKNLYRHWMENVKDWCISRQLWWGHRIPAWYTQDGSFTVAKTAEEALTELKTVTGNASLTIADIYQDQDCLDTWFSSWLWPFEVFNGLSKPNNEEVNYYYPTSTLVTAPEIIFFWVARMIMAGYEYKGAKPFNDVYFTGIVRDKLGRKMSKSLGNSPDLLGLIDQYGADAVRFGILIASPAGNDILFDESSLEQGRNFNNKLWNALKLVKMWEARLASTSTCTDSEEATFAINWFENRLNQVSAEVDELMTQFKLSEALKTIYSLIWDDFCSWYLEWAKPGFEQPVDPKVYNKTIEFFEKLMELLHPIMPFITEEIFHLLKEQNEDLTVKLQGKPIPADETILAAGSLLKDVITKLRDARNKNQLKPKDPVVLHIMAENTNGYKAIEPILMKQVNASSVVYTSTAVANTIVVNMEKDKFFIEAEQQLDTAAIKDRLLKDLDYEQNFLASVMKKLSNEKFVQNAKPEIIALERKKQADAEARIKTIEESLKSL